MGARVGIVVPCFNQGRYAAECIASLHAQAFVDWRAVLVDDASTDGTSPAQCDALAGAKVQVLHLERNAGRSLVRNAGVEALGPVEYVLMVDCDDALTPAYVGSLVAALDADAGAGLAYGTLDLFRDGEAETLRSWPTQPWDAPTMYLENRIPGPGTMFRNAALRQTAGWRAEFTRCSGEDYDIWLQVLESGWRPLWVAEARYRYRQHAASFLAEHGAKVALEHDVAILRLHARPIREAGAMAAYLRQKILPQLTADIRHGRWLAALRVMRGLMPCAGRELIAGLRSYYTGRLRIRAGVGEQP